MKSKIKNDNGRRTSDTGGFSFWRSRFDDPKLEEEFWDKALFGSRDIWRTLSIVLVIALSLTLAVYQSLATNPVFIVKLCLFALICICAFIRVVVSTVWGPTRRHLVPALIALSAEFVALPIVFVSARWEALTPIVYLLIIIGGVVHVKKRFRFTLIMVPAVLFLAFIGLQLSTQFDRFIIYQIGFTVMFVALSVSTSFNREHTERIEFIATRQRTEALRKADRLLANVLPESVAARVKEQDIAEVRLVEKFDEVSVLFVDLVGFTKFAAGNEPEKTIDLLNNIFRRFDAIVEQCGIEKIKTMGDAYLAVSGLPVRVSDHAQRVANAALEMREAMVKFRYLLGVDLELRIGIHSGPVIAGILGTKKFLYDIWGDTVNMASRLESHGVPGTIQISAATKALLEEQFKIKSRGSVQIKDKGEMDVYILESPRLTGTVLAA